MLNINFLKKPKRWSEKTKVIIVALLVFLIGLSASYVLLGNKAPFGRGVWLALSKVFPLPVANVNGQEVYYSELETATAMGVEEPMDFIVEFAAIKSTAKSNGVSVTNEEMAKYQKQFLVQLRLTLEELDHQTAQKNVDHQKFINLFFRNDALRSELAIAKNAPNAEVTEVQEKLKSGGDFEELAAQYSDDPVSSELGGDIGFVSEAEDRKSVV